MFIYLQHPALPVELRSFIRSNPWGRKKHGIAVTTVHSSSITDVQLYVKDVAREEASGIDWSKRCDSLFIYSGHRNYPTLKVFAHIRRLRRYLWIWNLVVERCSGIIDCCLLFELPAYLLLLLFRNTLGVITFYLRSPFYNW